MTSMAHATIGLDVFQTLDITTDFTFEITFNLETFNELTNSIFLIDSEILWFSTWINLNRFQNMEST